MAIGILTHGFASVAEVRTGFWDGEKAHTIVCYDQQITALTATANQNEVDILLDLMTTTFYNPGVNSVTISSSLGGVETDYIGIGPGDWTDSAVNMQVYVTDISANRVLVGEFTLKGNWEPVLFAYEKVNTNLIELVITSSSPVTMTTLQCGARLDMPKTPDVGYMPGYLNNLDIVSNPATEGNAFGVSRVLPRGWEESAPFSDLEMTFIRETIPPLIAHKGKPLFLSWNVEEFPNEVIYGQFSLSTIVYTNVVHGGVTITVNGVL